MLIDVIVTDQDKTRSRQEQVSRVVGVIRRYGTMIRGEPAIRRYMS